MLTKTEVIDAVLQGIIESNQFYEKISRGRWLVDSAVEGLMQYKISESIYNSNKNVFHKEGHALILEFHIKEIIENCRDKNFPGKLPN